MAYKMRYRKPRYITGKRWTNRADSCERNEWLLEFDWCHYCKVEGHDYATGGLWMWTMACGRTRETFRVGKTDNMEGAMRAAEEAYITMELSK